MIRSLNEVNMLKKGWFVQDSIEKTLENLIAESELELFTSTESKEFEQRLIDEVRTIAVYPVETEPVVEPDVLSRMNSIYHGIFDHHQKPERTLTVPSVSL